MREDEEEVEAMKAASSRICSEMSRSDCTAPELSLENVGGVNAFSAYTYQCLMDYATRLLTKLAHLMEPKIGLDRQRKVAGRLRLSVS